jgi:hypothetical protein
MQHIRVYVNLFGAIKYCIWGGNVSDAEAGEIAAAGAVISKYLPIDVETSAAS